VADGSPSTTPPGGRSGPIRKVHLEVPPDYHDLPEKERLEIASQLASRIQSGIRSSSLRTAPDTTITRQLET